MNYTQLASDASITKASESLNSNGFTTHVVAGKSDALEAVKKLIPKGVSLMNGTSKTLAEIGFIDLLKQKAHEWNNLHDGILAEKDSDRQNELRKLSVISDYYIGSAHAITESGELLIASASGSQLPHLVYTSQNIVIVVGAQKIVPTMSDALDRIETHVFPLENQRMADVGMSGSVYSKLLILKKEPSFMGRQFHVVIVKENLGF